MRSDSGSYLLLLFSSLMAYTRYTVSWILRMLKKPQSSVLAAAKGRLRNTAESEWSLYSITVVALRGFRVWKSCTSPVRHMESILGPVENTSVYPGNILPSLLSAMAPVRSRV